MQCKLFLCRLVCRGEAAIRHPCHAVRSQQYALKGRAWNAGARNVAVRVTSMLPSTREVQCFKHLHMPACCGCMNKLEADVVIQMLHAMLMTLRGLKPGVYMSGATWEGS